MKNIFFYVGTDLKSAGENLSEMVEYPPYGFAVSRFMSQIGMGWDKWDFILNTGAGNTAAGGNRSFCYYPNIPSPRWRYSGHAWTAAASAYRDFLKSPARFGGVERFDLHTAALRCNVMNVEASEKKIKLRGANRAVVKEVDNCSGKSLKATMDAFIDKLGTVINTPFFAVCDCNCFHNSAYIMGKLALRRVVGPADNSPVLIINVDQHLDADCDATLVNSDGWGHALLRNFRNGAYISIGCRGVASAEQTYCAVRRNGQPVKKLVTSKRVGIGPKKMTGLPWISKKQILSLLEPDPTNGKKNSLRDHCKTFWAFLERYIRTGEYIAASSLDPPQSRFKYFYITVDRDCMIWNYTKWGHVEAMFRNPGHVRTLLDVVVESLKDRGAKLVAMDTTGLPDKSNEDMKPRLDDYANVPAPQANRIYPSLKSELKELHKSFTNVWLP